MKVLAVIPARLQSTRLPEKPLADIHGKPMIQWVYERAAKATKINDVVVATDDERVGKVVRAFGGKVVMTSTQIHSGTDRVAAVAKEIEADIYVNVQGDEPMMSPIAIDRAVELVSSGRFSMGTVMTPIKNASTLATRNMVKVIADKQGRAIYFSRLPIPYGRKEGPDAGEGFVCRRHVGLYVYTRETLKRFSSLPPSALEQCEMLEQLRALEDGIAIGITEVDFDSMEVNTPEELEQVRKLLQP